MRPLQTIPQKTRNREHIRYSGCSLHWKLLIKCYVTKTVKYAAFRRNIWALNSGIPIPCFILWLGVIPPSYNAIPLPIQGIRVIWSLSAVRTNGPKPDRREKRTVVILWETFRLSQALFLSSPITPTRVNLLACTTQTSRNVQLGRNPQFPQNFSNFPCNTFATLQNAIGLTSCERKWILATIFVQPPTRFQNSVERSSHIHCFVYRRANLPAFAFGSAPHRSRRSTTILWWNFLQTTTLFLHPIQSYVLQNPDTLNRSTWSRKGLPTTTTTTTTPHNFSQPVVSNFSHHSNQPHN